MPSEIHQFKSIFIFRQQKPLTTQYYDMFMLYDCSSHQCSPILVLFTADLYSLGLQPTRGADSGWILHLLLASQWASSVPQTEKRTDIFQVLAADKRPVNGGAKISGAAGDLEKFQLRTKFQLP